MNVCIIGWYGTETLGDRAILDGIVSIWQKVSNDNNYYIGSIYPLVTERTILEDRTSLESHGGNSNFYCFDIKNSDEFKVVLNKADVLLMGGGPLMDIAEMYIIESAFKKAFKKKIPTILMGCGYGPLKSPEYINCLKRILKNTNLVIMRSSKCKALIKKLTNKEVFSLCDPAIISCYCYKINNKSFSKDDYVICNIRDIGYVYNAKNDSYLDDLTYFFDCLCQKFKRVVLYPMHTFSVGGDDRSIQNLVLYNVKAANLEVINKPLSLYECYDYINCAKICIGMRYHSVIFQTIINGNNYVLDYTEKETGKIGFLMKEYDMDDFYKERYVNLLDAKLIGLVIDDNEKKFIFNEERIIKDELEYVNLLKNIKKNKKI